MKKHLLLALSLSTQVHSFESNYWEEVFNTSMEKQAEAQLANFRDFPLQNEPSSAFGMRLHPITQENRLHHGVDFPGKEGDPFVAVAHGTVIFSGDNGSMGMTIAVDHGDGLVTRYGHAKNLNYAVGDKVRRGDEIGTIGATGLVTGPHLHFEVIQDGEHIDPEVFIAQRKAITVEELSKQLIEAPAVDIDSYVENQLQHNQAISNESFEGYAVVKAVSDFEATINQNQLVASVDMVQQQIGEFADSNVQQILDKVTGDDILDMGDTSQLADAQQQVAPEATPEQTVTDNAPTDAEQTDVMPASEVESEGIFTKRTLWAIADEIKPAGATVYQSMYAIYSLNPSAFAKGNMNQRYLDVAIKLPGDSEINQVDPDMAKTKYYEDLNQLTEAETPSSVQLSQTTPQ